MTRRNIVSAMPFSFAIMFLSAVGIGGGAAVIIIAIVRKL